MAENNESKFMNGIMDEMIWSHDRIMAYLNMENLIPLFGLIYGAAGTKFKFTNIEREAPVLRRKMFNQYVRDRGEIIGFIDILIEYCVCEKERWETKHMIIEVKTGKDTKNFGDFIRQLKKYVFDKEFKRESTELVIIVQGMDADKLELLTELAGQCDISIFNITCDGSIERRCNPDA